MTANGLTTMFLGEKKNRTSKAALLNLSFSRAACLPFAIILLCGRVETNSINPVSQGKVTGQKPCIHAGLSRFDGYSHSMSSGQKGCLEEAHTLLRMILPKGTLFTDLTQWDVRRIVNHMNSYARKNLEGATPYQLALKKYGPEILEALQIKFIPPDEVTMSPDLLKK